MKRVDAYKAQPVGASTAEAVEIVIKDELPNNAAVWPQRHADTVDAMDVDARSIAQALCESLPGGTLDRLCAELMRRQASRLHVAHVWPEASE